MARPRRCRDAALWRRWVQRAKAALEDEAVRDAVRQQAPLATRARGGRDGKNYTGGGEAGSLLILGRGERQHAAMHSSEAAARLTRIVTVATAAAVASACGGEDGAPDYLAHPEECGAPTGAAVAAGDYALEWQCMEGACDQPSAYEGMPKSAEVPSSRGATVSAGPTFPGVFFDGPPDGLWIWTRLEAECVSLRSAVTAPGELSLEIGRLCATSAGAFGHYATPNARWLLCAKLSVGRL